MVRFFAYINVKGVHGALYTVANTETNRDVLSRLLTVMKNDVFSIKGIGYLIVEGFDIRTTYHQGIEERYIYFETRELWDDGKN